MRIHTETVFDIESGRILSDKSFKYAGNCAMCDRSMQKAGANAVQNAQSTAGMYGSTAGQIGSNIIPQLEKFTLNPPGYGPSGLATMKTEAEAAGAATTGRAAQDAKLRAMRTGNVAGLGSEETALAEAGARGTGANIQNILSEDARLKETQRQNAFSGLENIYGKNISGQLESASQIPADIDATLKAGQSGWLQNLSGVLGTLGGLGTGAGSFINAMRRPGTTPTH